MIDRDRCLRKHISKELHRSLSTEPIGGNRLARKFLQYAWRERSIERYRVHVHAVTRVGEHVERELFGLLSPAMHGMQTMP